jgi:hypothetical protein
MPNCDCDRCCSRCPHDPDCTPLGEPNDPSDAYNE